jgi:hypothetical protein
MRSRQDLVMVDLLDSFLNLLKLFLAVASDCTKRLLENGRGCEIEMNGEPAMPILVVRGEGGGLKQNSRHMDGSLNNILFMQPLCGP